MSRDEAIDQYIELFAAAMAKRPPTPGSFAVPISGGRDSRHILLELHRTGFEPSVCASAMDYPPSSNEDPVVGAALCGALGFRHAVINQRLSQFAAQVRKNRETNFCAQEHSWYLALADAMNGRVACAYDGIGGDVLSNSLCLDRALDAVFHAQDVTAICNTLLARYAPSVRVMSRVLKGPLKACSDPGLASKRLTKEVARHLGAPNPVGQFFFWNRTRRQIALAPYALLHDVARVYAPYVDHDLFDFLTSLPSSMLLDHRFHDDTIARAYPKFAGIPYARKAAPDADAPATRAKFAADAARTLLPRKLSRLVKTIGPRMKMAAVLLSRGRVNPWISPIMIYLHQIEALIDAPSHVGGHHMPTPVRIPWHEPLWRPSPSLREPS